MPTATSAETVRPRSRFPLANVADLVSSVLIYFMVVFSPWAFGTTQLWSIWTMNFAGYSLGILQALARVGQPSRMRFVDWALAGLTAFILAWCFTSAINASAEYSLKDLQFTYRDHIKWLPHSFDAKTSWQYFWNYLGMACAFWGIRSWLLTGADLETVDGKRRRGLPRRLQVLLWILSINGSLLALEGLIQRVSGTGKLLWLIEPPVNKDAASQFGPFAYRSNAAQLLNLILPLTLGLWALLHRRYRRNEKGQPVHHLLLSCVMIMAACPMMSDSRAAAIVTVGLALGSSVILYLSFSGESWRFRASIAFFSLAAIGLGLNVGWDTLTKRMRTIDKDYELRESIYVTARKIAADYPFLGTGPGTFDPVFQMYRSSPDEYWPAQLHNDWLETRLTFGGIGFAAALLALGLVLGRWLLPGDIPVSWTLAGFFWLAIAGCLLHARFDFPFQIYSIVFLFLVLCAILSTFSRKT